MNWGMRPRREMAEGDRMGELFASLDRRRRPEDVARLIADELHDVLAPDEAQILQGVARHASRFGGVSSMATDFARPVGAASQLATAAELFVGVPAPGAEQQDDPAAVTAYLGAAEPLIGKTVGRSDFKRDRLDRAKRRAAGLDWSKRQYNKRFRLAARLEDKVRRLEREWEKRAMTLISKSRLASRLAWADFAADRDSACFIAYYAARCNLRSEFTVDGQQRPYDEVAEALFNRCRRSPRTNWWAIAHVFPDAFVLGRLDDERKGQLLGLWLGVLERTAGLLRDLWEANSINRRTMIVRRGNDSTTWNGTAGAWNKAREAWFAVLYAMGLDGMIDAFCPGKALRLMAADVAAWHRAMGNDLDQDTLVWSELPLPWEVMSGAATCTRTDVEAACRRHGVDPLKGGWVAARSGPRVQTFRPTPELVHGVTVGHPALASVLRKAGAFSGQ